MKSTVTKVAVSLVLAVGGWWFYQTPAVALSGEKSSSEPVLADTSHSTGYGAQKKMHAVGPALLSRQDSAFPSVYDIPNPDAAEDNEVANLSSQSKPMHQRYDEHRYSAEVSSMSSLVNDRRETAAKQGLSATSLNPISVGLIGAFEVSNVEVRLEDVNLEASGGNHKPRVNPSVLKQLQTTVKQWAFSQQAPANYFLPLQGLFNDPDGDTLTQRASLNIAGITVTGNDTLHIQGIPQAPIVSPVLHLAARDDFHGTGQAAWAKVNLSLPSVEPLPEEPLHPLEAKTLYRLETTHLLEGVYYNYEVVFCEAWRFIDGVAYFAASDNRTQCPQDIQLQEIGYYSFNEHNDLILNSNVDDMRQQRWQLKKEYPSTLQPGVTNYFTTVYGNSANETYTMQASKRAMEARLNIRTGEYEYQMVMFDYLYPQANGQYVLGQIGNYIYDWRLPGIPHESMDSDLNMQSWLSDLSCAQLRPFWQSSEMAGQGETGDIISNSYDPYGKDPHPIECDHWWHDEWKKEYVFMNLHYNDYDIFVPGEIYSYVLKPKPQYAHLVEEVKLNFQYFNRKD